MYDYPLTFPSPFNDHARIDYERLGIKSANLYKIVFNKTENFSVYNRLLKTLYAILTESSPKIQLSLSNAAQLMTEKLSSATQLSSPIHLIGPALLSNAA